LRARRNRTRLGWPAASLRMPLTTVVLSCASWFDRQSLFADQRGMRACPAVALLCIIAQGAKTVIVGEEVYEYDASRMIASPLLYPLLPKSRKRAVRTLPRSKAGPRPAQDCRTGLEGVSRGVPPFKSGAPLRRSGRREYRQRRDKTNGMSSAAGDAELLAHL